MKSELFSYFPSLLSINNSFGGDTGSFPDDNDHFQSDFGPGPLIFIPFIVIPVVWVVLFCIHLQRQRRIANDVHNHIARAASQTIVVTAPDAYAPPSPHYTSYQQQYAQPVLVQPVSVQPVSVRPYQQQYAQPIHVIPQQTSQYTQYQTSGPGTPQQYQQQPYNPSHVAPAPQPVAPHPVPLSQHSNNQQQPATTSNTQQQPQPPQKDSTSFAPPPPSYDPYTPYTDTPHHAPPTAKYNPYNTQSPSQQQSLISPHSSQSDQSY